jgi:hypothetical protein
MEFAGSPAYSVHLDLTRAGRDVVSRTSGQLYFQEGGIAIVILSSNWDTGVMAGDVDD